MSGGALSGPDNPACRGVIGIAGLGSIGRRHAAVATRAGLDVRVYDPVPRTGSELPDETARCTYARLEDLLESGLDALVVASPDRFHRLQVMAAVERGIPTLVEKPVAHSLGDGEELARALAGSDVPVLVGYVLRYSRALQRARELIRAGELGEVASFHVHLGAYETLVRARNRFDSSETGAIYYDYSHEWDYLRWLIGSVVRGTAAERTVRGLPVVQDPNVVDGLLELENGCIGSFHLDYVQQPSTRSLAVVGTDATLLVDVPRGSVVVRRRAGAGTEESSSFEQKRDALFEEQLEHLLAIAARREVPRVTVGDGVAALRVAEGLRMAARRRRWVDFEGL